MKITDEAVEAAAKALARVDDRQWIPIPRYLKDTHLSNARIALAAAVPIMLGMDGAA